MFVFRGIFDIALLLLLRASVVRGQQNLTDDQLAAVYLEAGYPPCMLQCNLYALKVSNCPRNDSGKICICNKTDILATAILNCLSTSNSGCTQDDFLKAISLTSNGCQGLGSALLPNGTSFGNLTSNYTLPTLLPTAIPKPSSSPSTSPILSPHKLSTGAYAGIGASTAIVGALALGIGIFWMLRRRRQNHEPELEGAEKIGPVELFDKSKDAVEMAGDHGVSEAPAAVVVQPQELDSRPLGLQEILRVPRMMCSHEMTIANDERI